MGDSSSSDVESASQVEGDTCAAKIVQNGRVNSSSASDEIIFEATGNHSDNFSDNKPSKGGNCDNTDNCSITDVTELSQDEQSSFSEQSREKNNYLKFKFPQLDFQSDWYNNTCFHSYWEHYSQVMLWCQKHYQTYYSLQNRYMWPSAQSPWQNPYWHMFPRHQHVQSQTGEQKKARKRHRRPRSRTKKTKEDTVTEETATQTGDSEAFEMEITQDMMDFFSKSHEHRKQREEAKREEVEKEATESAHVNVEDVKIGAQKERTVEAPKEQPGLRRTAQMKLLYGKGAAMIHGMETAIQMTYDRNVDVKQPKLWPNMPLKVIFG